MSALRIAVAGAGRMGQTVAEAIEDAPDLTLSGIWNRGEPLTDLVAGADVLIDFSLPEATDEVLAAVRDRGKALVCGVSGLDEARMKTMRALANDRPVVFDRNMSQGIAVLDAIVKRAAATLGGDFSIEVHETHHVHKLDSPSGTALQLAESLAAARGLESAEPDIRFEIERRGEVPGDHTVIFRSSTETLSLRHSVTTRRVFAEGALRAARWVHGRPPGFYHMRDVLFGDS